MKAFNAAGIADEIRRIAKDTQDLETADDLQDLAGKILACYGQWPPTPAAAPAPAAAPNPGPRGTGPVPERVRGLTAGLATYTPALRLRRADLAGSIDLPPGATITITIPGQPTGPAGSLVTSGPGSGQPGSVPMV